MKPRQTVADDVRRRTFINASSNRLLTRPSGPLFPARGGGEEWGTAVELRQDYVVSSNACFVSSVGSEILVEPVRKKVPKPRRGGISVLPNDSHDSFRIRPDAAPDGAWNGLADVVLQRRRPYGASPRSSPNSTALEGKGEGAPSSNRLLTSAATLEMKYPAKPLN
jgi:hypothetical protein